jgi:hypothetical protein
MLLGKLLDLKLDKNFQNGAPLGAKKCQNPLFCDVPAHFIGIYGLFIKTM